MSRLRAPTWWTVLCHRYNGKRPPPRSFLHTQTRIISIVAVLCALLHQICFDGFKEPNDIAANLNVAGKFWKLPTETSDRLQSMQRLNSQRKASAKFINYTCNAYNAEFGSSHAYNVHRRHPSSQGTPCSLDANKSEVTHTERQDHSIGFLRRHLVGSSKLGASSYNVC